MGELEDELQRLRQQVRELEARLQVAAPSGDLQLIFDSMSEGVQILDHEGRYLYLNQAAARQGRRDRDELAGKRIADMYPGIEQTEFYALLQHCLKDRQHHKILNHFSYPDGSRGWFDLRLSPVPAGAIILSTDVSNVVKLEEDLRNAERLEAIGRLAGGVAHDFNNLLGVVLGYANLLSDSLEKGDPRAADLAEIVKAADRAGNLTRQLLAFGRKQVLQPKVVDVNEVVASMGKMLARLIGEHIDLAVRTEAKLDKVMVDPGQLEQVVMNLALNARDAMPLGGKLTVETGNVSLDPDYAALHPGTLPGPHVLLAVTDTGYGMDTQTLSHVFEPFFTTKGLGKGTGLGLATVHGIVKQSGGHIWVYSEPGRGTCFKVYFPSTATPGAGVPAPQDPQSAAAVVRGNARVLLVEDEDPLRALLFRVLNGAGYKVKAVGSAEEALKVLGTGYFDLLLSDVVLPGLNGRELASQARALYPEIKVALMSGYTDNAIMHQGALDEDMAFIEKPVAPNALLERLARILVLG